MHLRSIFIVSIHIAAKLSDGNTSQEWESEAMKVVRRFLGKCLKSFKSSSISYHNDAFLKHNEKWLSGTETFPELNFKKPVSSEPSTSKRGRPQVKLVNLSLCKFLSEHFAHMHSLNFRRKILQTWETELRGKGLRL